MSLPVPEPSDGIDISGDDEAWAAGLSSIFVELEMEQLDPAHPPIGRMYRYRFGDMTFVRGITRGGAHRVIRSSRLIRSSAHNNFFIGYLLAGSATLSQGKSRAVLEPGDLAILDSTREYVIEVPNDFDALWIRVPRHRLEGRLHSLAGIMAQKVTGKSGVGHIASSILQAMLAQTISLRIHEVNRITNHLLDLIGLALTDTQEQPQNNTASKHHLATLRRVQTYIEEHLDDENLSAGDTARAHNLSVRYLNKLFEREGTSIMRWIRTRRLERCRSDLENSSHAKRTISDIAYSHGFSNISNFNRAFKAHFGCSPGALRIRQYRIRDNQQKT